MPRYSQEFVWPVNGFGRGFHLELTDSAGHAVRGALSIIS